MTAVAILVALVLALGDYVASIPNAVLAGILVKVALDTIDWRFVTRLHRVQREHMVVMLLTLGLTVLLDLVAAVAVGMIAAAVTSARQFECLEMDIFSARVGLVALKGTFTVASSSKLMTPSAATSETTRSLFSTSPT